MERAALLVGNFLSGPTGEASGRWAVCEELADKLAGSGWAVTRTSSYQRRIRRVADMVSTAWRKRGEYAVAQVDVYSGPAFIWAEAVCWTLRQSGRPYVLTLHGGNLPSFARRQPRRVGRLLASANAVTTPSRYLQQQMKTYREDLHLLPNPLDTEDYPFRLREAPQPRLVWLRAFHHLYNPSLAARVVSQLAGQFSDVELVMVGMDKGDGSLQDLRRVADDLGVADRITIREGVPKAEVPRWLSQGDIFLNTTHADNTPVSVMEAMACGLCVVSTNVGGLPYLLKDGQTGLMVAPNDAEAMSDAVRRVLVEPGLAAALSRQARDEANSFDWKVILPQWEELLLGIGEE